MSLVARCAMKIMVPCYLSESLLVAVRAWGLLDKLARSESDVGQAGS